MSLGGLGWTLSEILAHGKLAYGMLAYDILTHGILAPQHVGTCYTNHIG